MERPRPALNVDLGRRLCLGSKVVHLRGSVPHRAVGVDATEHDSMQARDAYERVRLRLGSHGRSASVDDHDCHGVNVKWPLRWGLAQIAGDTMRIVWVLVADIDPLGLVKMSIHRIDLVQPGTAGARYFAHCRNSCKQSVDIPAIDDHAQWRFA